MLKMRILALMFVMVVVGCSSVGQVGMMVGPSSNPGSVIKHHTDLPNGQPAQPLSPEALTQRTAEATLHKLEAEAKLVEVQLEQAKRANEAATREARAWHAHYSFG